MGVLVYPLAKVPTPSARLVACACQKATSAEGLSKPEVEGHLQTERPTRSRVRRTEPIVSTAASEVIRSLLFNGRSLGLDIHPEAFCISWLLCVIWICAARQIWKMEAWKNSG